MPIKVETYDFKSTRISEFRFVNDTSSTFVIRTNDNGNEIQAQNIIYTPNGLAEGEEFTIKIEKTTLSKISDNPSKKYYSRYKVNTTQYVLKFTYSKFSRTHALVKASNLGDLKKDNVIYKELEREYVFKTCYISEFTLNNDTNNNISVQTDSEPLATLQKNQSKTYTLSRLPEESIFKVIITSYDPKASKNFIYVISCYHSNYSNAYVKLNASTLNSINEKDIFFQTDTDHRSNHVKRLELHSVAGVGYCAKFRIYFKTPGSDKWDYKTSSSFSLGQHKYWDCIEELHLPDNTMVRPAVCSILNLVTKNVYKEKQHDDIWYVRHNSTTVKKYKCTGTVASPKIERY